MNNSKKLMYDAFGAAAYNEAVRIADEILSTDQDDWDAIYIKASVKSLPIPELYDEEGALLLAESAVQRKPDDVTRWLGLAEIRTSCGKYEDAEGAYRYVLSMDPRNLQATVGLACLIDHPGVTTTLEACRQLLQQARQTYPSAWEPYYYGAHIEWELGRVQEARSLFESALIRLSPTDDLMRGAIGGALGKLPALE